MSDGAAPERDQSELFELLGDETRLAIVAALAEPRRTNWQWEGMTFAELRRAVGMRDGGNFSYHLDRLEREYVVKEGDEYKLTNSGLELAGSLAAGRYDPAETTDRGTTAYACPYPDCERHVDVIYEYGFLRAQCDEHGVFQAATLPPALVAHSNADQLLRFATLTNHHDVQWAREGVCPHCKGAVEATLPTADPKIPAQWGEEIPDEAVFVGFDCADCGLWFTVSPGTCVVDHPAVVSLYHDHGLDVRTLPYSELAFVGALHPTVEPRDPVRVRLDVALDGDVLTLYLDDDAAVVEYDREDGRENGTAT